MKYKSSLEKVLVHRNRIVDLAKKDLADAMANLAEEQNKLNHLLQQKTDSLKNRSDLIQSTQNWFDKVEQINNFLKWQDLRIEQQNKRLCETEKLVESCREILRERLTEVKVISNLYEKRKANYLNEIAKKEVADLDELASLRYTSDSKYK